MPNAGADDCDQAEHQQRAIPEERGDKRPEPDEERQAVQDPINRYAIGDRTAGLKKDADGGLTIYLQSSSPGQDKESNWLPTTQNGLFLLVLRTYIPGKDILEQTYAVPRSHRLRENQF